MEQVSDALGQIRQFDGAIVVAGGGVERDQRTQATAVDVGHARQIEHDAFALVDYHSHRVAQVGGLFAKNNAASAVDHDNVIYSSDRQFQLHAFPQGQKANTEA